MAVKIAPSLLAANFTRLAEEIQKLEKAGADVLHLDIMDGHFVPNITFGFPVIAAMRPLTKLPFDAHLMIENADRYLEEFKKAGCDWLSVHVEACPHLHRTLNRIKELGMKAGIAINPGTSLSALDGALGDADYVLIMSVNPGYGGQKFVPASIDRVRELKRKIGGRKIEIQIDGGIKESNAGEVIGAGADILVVGTGLLGTADYAKTTQALKAAGNSK